MRLPLLFRFREPLATLPSLVVLAVLVLAGVQKATELKRKEDPQPVQIALMELPPPPPPQPKPQIEPPPKPVEPPRKQEAPKPAVRPAPARPAAPPAEPTPTSETPVLPAATPPAAPAQSAPVARPAVSAPPVNTANIELTYVGQLRAHLNSIKRYPTGREASTLRPQGKVRVWFVLRRDGSVVDTGIDSSSNSMLLDDAARKTINRASFAPFPQDSYPGEATHRFTADLEFIPV